MSQNLVVMIDHTIWMIRLKLKTTQNTNKKHKYNHKDTRIKHTTFYNVFANLIVYFFTREDMRNIISSHKYLKLYKLYRPLKRKCRVNLKYDKNTVSRQFHYHQQTSNDLTKKEATYNAD